MKQKVRIFSPYEQNELKKYGFSPSKAKVFGEMPIEYITGHTQFCGYDFLVNQSVLIPRLETEQMVDLTLQYLKSHPKKKMTVADIGCGSGCIGLSLFLKLKEKKGALEFILSDISKEALLTTKLNLRGLGLEDFSNSPLLLYSNLFAKYPTKIKFDLVLANLPYIPSQRMDNLAESVKNYEPKVALNGGKKGLEIIYKLLYQLINRLKQNGWAILEIDDTHKLKDFKRFSRYFSLMVVKDCFGKNRFLILARPSRRLPNVIPLVK